MKKIFISITFLFALEICTNAQSANVYLSNLSSTTAINHSLVPLKTSIKNLGSSTRKWKNLFLSGTLHTDSIKAGTGGIFVSDGGISGFSSSGTGVYGSGANTGVYGNGETYGIFGNSDQYVGVYGNGGPYGIFGNSNQYAGVYGYGINYGVMGNSNLIGVDGTGDYAGVNGFSSEGYGGDFESANTFGIIARADNGAYAGVFYGSVWTTGSYVSSDENIKKNIREFTNAMIIINKLKPEYYEFKDDPKYASLHLPQGSHYGLLAQDLEEVLPGLVKESAHEIGNRNIRSIKPPPDGKPLSVAAIAEQLALVKATPEESITIKAVNYTELIPIMIKGMQEEHAQIEKQQTQMQDLIAKNDDLQNQVNELKSLMAKRDYTTASALGYLKQNLPNPSGNNTIIRYYLTDNAGRAQIRITDEKGNTLKVYNASKGDGRVDIISGGLPAGAYNYTLYINDNKIDSKQMLITK